MPGLVGIVNRKKSLAEEVVKARKKMKYFNSYRDDPLFDDGIIVASGTHLDLIENSFAENDRCYCWVQGEAYSLRNSLPEYLLVSYKRNELLADLKKIDGYFCAVLYDQTRSTIKLISDRYGLKPIYYWHGDGRFAWASELKAFSEFNDFPKSILPDAINCFLELGHLIGDMTWFKAVSLLSPATVLSYDITTGSTQAARYWSWSCIKALKIGFHDAGVILSELIKSAVSERIQGKNSLILTLSGGLDSRAILACVDASYKIQCLSFGKRESLDLEIAKNVAAVKGVTHKIIEIESNNWLNGRLEGIWRSDGMISLCHMHGISILSECSMSFNLNGFAGDIICGGGWIKFPNTRISSRYAQEMFKEFHTIDPIENDFYDILHEDAYVINNRVRRFTNGGSILQSLKIEQLKPFLSNKIIEHIYALPDEYRIKSKLYRYALLREHSDLFKAIPWQKTGKTIDKELNIIDFILNGFKNRLIKNGIIADNKNFVDYKNWMKCQNIAAFFANILDKSGAIYPNFCNRDLKNEFLIPYLNNEANYYEKVGRAVTIEIWLQQTFNNSFLTLPSNVPNFS